MDITRLDSTTEGTEAVKGTGEGTILFCPIRASIDQICIEFVHILETDFTLIIHASK